MLRQIISTALAVVLALTAVCAVATPVAVPAGLTDWKAWALDGKEYLRCPFQASSTMVDESAYRCVWPERLTLSVDARGGKFAQHWQVFAESWVRLPGGSEHWPQDVRVDGVAGAVVLHDGYPMLRLEPGSHSASGSLYWSMRPESISIDPRTALVDLTLDGKSVAQPERPDGAVWLGKRRSAEQAERMEVQVYRLVRDQVPVELYTRLRLQVSGDAREELLGQALPAGFTPVRLEGALAARLERNGQLRVQVRPGSWEITLAARGTGAATELTRPPLKGPWAREEIWSFQSDDRLRISAVEGLEGIDPAQANVPAEWRGFPAFRMAADSKLRVVERSRGLQSADDNRLSLTRSLWLDFNHEGMTARDRIRGTMRRDWRLETTAPFALESASNGGDDLLVTRNPGKQGVGVEVRTPALDLQSTLRSSRSRGSLPATGWNTRFDSVSGELNLPPGHRLLAVPGADEAPTAWLDVWGLWGVFGVLVVAVFAGWLVGWPVGIIAFVALMLTYQEEPAYIWLWSNVLAAAALARAAPEGRLLRLARGYRLAGFVVLGIALLPLLWGQLRLALYPQLEYTTLVRSASLMRAPLEATIAPAPAEVVSQANDGDAAGVATDAAGAAVDQVRAEEMSSIAFEAQLPKATNISSRPRGLNYEQVVQRYAPGTLLQTGPGIPEWRYRVHPYSWSGPVESTQSVRFVYIGPVLLGVWRVVGAALLAGLFIALLDGSGAMRAPRLSGWISRLTRRAAVAATIVVALAALAVPQARAEATPDADLLAELQSRLTRAPDCVPSCADISAARITAHRDQLEVELVVSALATVAVAMPGAGDRWQLESVTIDGRSTLSMTRESDETQWIPVTPGTHKVRLAGRLAPAESIQLMFPATPRRVSATSEGWDVTGINEERLLSGSVELTRRRGATDAASSFERASEFPAFVQVQRIFDLGLDWTARTLVQRMAPEKAAISVEVPLIAGESVLSESVEVRNGRDGERFALVGLGRGEAEVEWQSGLPRAERLELAMPAEAARTEVWRFTVSPQWNVEFSGIPSVAPENPGAGTWAYEFHPRPGEKLQLRIGRPQRADGPTFAIDSVRQALKVGKRSTTTVLEASYRSTQGGRHGFRLPHTARVTSVELDGMPIPVRPVGDELSVELQPGRHAMKVEWIMPAGATLRTQPAAVDLRSPASNINTSIDLAADRWPLMALGSGVGPAIVYWGELLIFLAMALLLGRSRHSPLRTHEWLLLGFGLSTRSWVVLVLVALWLFAMRWRESWVDHGPRWRFNTVQALLAGLTLVAVSSLVFTGIRGSLLASPDMGVQGPGSGWHHFSWFTDRTVAALPQPSVFSAPMWLYRVLMFAWALWLVFALLQWLRWAWRAWKTNGIWRGPESGVTQAP